MGAAIGSGKPVKAVRQRSDTVFDVWDWGGRPGDTTSGSVDTALERIRNFIIARDANGLGVNPNANPVIIRFRGSQQQWTLQRPFFVEKSNWMVCGDGQEQTTVTMARGLRSPCFIFGMPRAPIDNNFVGSNGTAPSTLKPDNWVDLYGILDSDAVAAPGTYWGYNLNGNSCISCPMTPFSHGLSDGWVSTRQLTVDFFVDFGSTTIGYGDLFGMGEYQGQIAGYYPWFLTTRPGGVIQFNFATTGVNQPSSQYISFQLGATTGRFRVSFQIDLASATAQAYVNKKQVAVTISNPTAFNAANDLRFVQNYFAPFNIGKRTVNVITFMTTNTVMPNQKYYGLRVANALMYADGPIDNTTVQFKINTATPPTDFERYFDIKRGCVACFPMTDPPVGNASCYNDGRCITIAGGNTSDTHGVNFTAVGYFLNMYIGGTPIFTTNNRIQDMTVLSGDFTRSGVNGVPAGSWQGAFGQAIAIGSVWEMYVKRIHARSYGHGIGSLNTGANYTVHLDDVTARGGDAGYYGYWQIIQSKNFISSPVGRTAIRLAGSSAFFRNTFFGTNYAQTEVGIHIHGDIYGGQYEFSQLYYDNEATAGPSQAGIICEGAFSSQTYLRITDLIAFSLADNAVMVWLKDNNKFSGTDYRNPNTMTPLRLFMMDGFTTRGSNHAAQIRTDGTLWGGEVRNISTMYGGYPRLEEVPMIENTGPGGLGRIKSVHTEYAAPPRSGTWTSGCHDLKFQLPIPGAFRSVQCGVTGTYGTATPPVWFGSELIDFDDTFMPGGYLTDTTYWAPVEF